MGILVLKENVQSRCHLHLHVKVGLSVEVLIAIVLGELVKDLKCVTPVIHDSEVDAITARAIHDGVIFGLGFEVQQ